MNNKEHYGKKNYRYVDRLILTVESMELLRIAGDNELTHMLCDSDGHPMIPGTSIAGSIRSYFIENPEFNKKYGYFFGGKVEKDQEDGFCDSKLYFYDSPLEGVQKKELHEYIEKRTEIRHDAKYGGAAAGGLHTMYYLKKGMTFVIQIECFIYDEEELKKVRNLYQEILNGIQSGLILFGSRKNNGCGRMKIVQNKSITYDLTKEDDFISYALDIPRPDKFKKMPIVFNITAPNSVRFVLKAKIKDALLIKTEKQSEHLEEKQDMTEELVIPDEVNMREDTKKERNIATSMKSGDDYIIPSATIKGVLRGYSQKICKTLGKYEGYVQEIFGNTADEQDERKAGHVRVGDCKIDASQNAELIYHRIKIDRFTGGVMNGALVAEKPITEGTLKMEITYTKLGDKKKDAIAFNLLYLCLRDLALGKIPLGSNGGSGFGRIRGLNLYIREGERGGTIFFDTFGMDYWIKEELEAGFEMLKGEEERED